MVLIVPVLMELEAAVVVPEQLVVQHLLELVDQE
tara:strand:+ start:377 stop:478 length:102 start_codon:yes stop_codon:yes gene_type:complete